MRRRKTNITAYNGGVLSFVHSGGAAAWSAKIGGGGNVTGSRFAVLAAVHGSGARLSLGRCFYRSSRMSLHGWRGELIYQFLQSINKFADMVAVAYCVMYLKRKRNQPFAVFLKELS